VLAELPWLVSMSHHKHWVFLIAGILISANFVYVYQISPKLRARRGACDLGDSGFCESAGRFSRAVLWFSALLYLIGCFTSYLLGPILVHLDS
jgi:mercuric ion transport protein